MTRYRIVQTRDGKHAVEKLEDLSKLISNERADQIFSELVAIRRQERKKKRAIHVSESERDDGPFCAVCRHGNIELSLYRGEWWCEECIEAEEEYEHDMEMTQ